MKNEESIEMEIVEGECWKCKQPIKVAFLTNVFEERGHSTCPPSSFMKQEIDFAKSKGVIIKEVHSSTADETYNANVCGHCDSFVGNHFIFSQYRLPAEMYGEFKFEKYYLDKV